MSLPFLGSGRNCSVHGIFLLLPPQFVLRSETTVSSLAENQCPRWWHGIDFTAACFFMSRSFGNSSPALAISLLPKGTPPAFFSSTAHSGLPRSSSSCPLVPSVGRWASLLFRQGKQWARLDGPSKAVGNIGNRLIWSQSIGPFSSVLSILIDGGTPGFQSGLSQSYLEMPRMEPGSR